MDTKKRASFAADTSVVDAALGLAQTHGDKGLIVSAALARWLAMSGDERQSELLLYGHARRKSLSGRTVLQEYLDLRKQAEGDEQGARALESRAAQELAKALEPSASRAPAPPRAGRRSA